MIAGISIKGQGGNIIRNDEIHRYEPILRLFGHFERRNDPRLPKTILNASKDVTRTRGKLWRTYLDPTKRDVRLRGSE